MGARWVAPALLAAVSLMGSLAGCTDDRTVRAGAAESADSTAAPTTSTWVNAPPVTTNPPAPVPTSSTVAPTTSTVTPTTSTTPSTAPPATTEASAPPLLPASYHGGLCRDEAWFETMRVHQMGSRTDVWWQRRRTDPTIWWYTLELVVKPAGAIWRSIVVRVPFIVTSCCPMPPVARGVAPGRSAVTLFQEEYKLPLLPPNRFSG